MVCNTGGKKKPIHPNPPPNLYGTSLAYITRFCLFLTRFAGRGCMYIFLGCMVCANLWDSSISPFLGFVICGILCGVGCVAIYTAFKIGKKLEAVRKALLNRGGPTPSICPPQGLKLDKFGELALKIQVGGPLGGGGSSCSCWDGSGWVCLPRGARPALLTVRLPEDCDRPRARDTPAQRIMSCDLGPRFFKLENF